MEHPKRFKLLRNAWKKLKFKDRALSRKTRSDRCKVSDRCAAAKVVAKAVYKASKILHSQRMRVIETYHLKKAAL